MPQFKFVTSLYYFLFQVSSLVIIILWNYDFVSANLVNTFLQAYLFATKYLTPNSECLLNACTESVWELRYTGNCGPKSPDLPFRVLKSLASLAVGSVTFLEWSHLSFKKVRTSWFFCFLWTIWAVRENLVQWLSDFGWKMWKLREQVNIP